MLFILWCKKTYDACSRRVVEGGILVETGVAVTGCRYVEQMVAGHARHGDHQRTVTEERGFTREILGAEIGHCLTLILLWGIIASYNAYSTSACVFPPLAVKTLLSTMEGRRTGCRNLRNSEVLYKLIMLPVEPGVSKNR